MKPQNHTLSPISYQPPAAPLTAGARTEQREQQLQHSAIASRAYTLWEKDGRPDGQDQSYWFKAEQQLHESTGRTFAES
jgi:hypothetical protein